MSVSRCAVAVLLATCCMPASAQEAQMRMQLSSPILLSAGEPEEIVVSVDGTLGTPRVNAPVSLRASSNIPGVTWSLEPQVPGLSISGGLVTGSAQDADPHPFRIVAAKGAMRGESDELLLDAVPLPSLTYTPASSYTVGREITPIVPQRHDFAGQASCGPVAATGSLPPGLSIAADCSIVGTPTTVVSRQFSVAGTDLADDAAATSNEFTVAVVEARSKATSYRYSGNGYGQQPDLRLSLLMDGDLTTHTDPRLTDGGITGLNTGVYGSGIPILGISPAQAVTRVSVSINCPFLYNTNPWYSLGGGNLDVWTKVNGNWVKQGSFHVPQTNTMANYDLTFNAAVVSEVELRTTVPSTACYIAEFTVN